MSNKSTYFGGLNELRAIAALSVIFHHVELYCYRDGVDSLFTNTFFSFFISNLGKNGVYLFFVLSGFLITTLLIKEKNNFGAINISKFYLRRIFRIWPLYFIIILFSVFLLKQIVQFNIAFFSYEKYYLSLIEKDSVGYNSVLYILFLSNFAHPIVGASQSWSVSVEEQFYLIWPHIVNKIKMALLPAVFISIILFSLCCKYFHLPIFNFLFKHFPLEFMALGGLFGYVWYYQQDRMRGLFKSNAYFIITIAITIAALFTPIPPFLCGVLFGFLILFVITERKINLRNKGLNWVGTISYGVYMYHPLIMFFSSAAIHNMMHVKEIKEYKIFLYLFTFSFTLIVSFLSYSLVEHKLIKYKDRKFNVQ